MNEWMDYLGRAFHMKRETGLEWNLEEWQLHRWGRTYRGTTKEHSETGKSIKSEVHEARGKECFKKKVSFILWSEWHAAASLAYEWALLNPNGKKGLKILEFIYHHCQSLNQRRFDCLCARLTSDNNSLLEPHLRHIPSMGVYIITSSFFALSYDLHDLQCIQVTTPIAFLDKFINYIIILCIKLWSSRSSMYSSNNTNSFSWQVHLKSSVWMKAQPLFALLSPSLPLFISLCASLLSA